MLKERGKMDDFNRLLEKLEAYKKLDDIANRRNIIDLLISFAKLDLTSLIKVVISSIIFVLFFSNIILLS